MSTPEYENYNTSKKSSDKSTSLIFTVLVSAAVAALVSFGAPYFMNMNQNTGNSDAEFDLRIQQSLQRNPDAVYGSLVEFQHREEEKQKQAVAKAVQDNKDQIFNDPASPVIGNSNGDVTIVEFFDYNCGHCRKIAGDTDRLVKEDGNIKVIHKQFPILPPETSREAAVVALALKDNPETYAAFHQALMGQKVVLTDALVRAIALQTAGLTSEQITADLGRPELKQQIEANYKLAQALSIQGTPAFIVGDEVMPGERNYDELKKAVADARAKGKAAIGNPALTTKEMPAPADNVAPAPETPTAPDVPAANGANTPIQLTPPAATDEVKPSPNQD